MITPPQTPSPSPFSADALRAECQQVLASATVPTTHGFAAIVDQDGAHVALATRVGDGWTVEADGGYDWAVGGWSGRLSIGKTWE